MEIEYKKEILSPLKLKSLLVGLGVETRREWEKS